MEEEKSGPLLFLDYAWPCAQGKKDMDKITEKDFLDLKDCVTHRIPPRIDLLERCFGDATQNLKGWSYEEVADYWHHHHGHTGDCAVRLAEVVEVCRRSAMVLIGNMPTRVTNFLNFQLEMGDEVFIHKNSICEKK